MEVSIINYRGLEKYSWGKIMVYFNPGCMGDYDFESIAFYARKRFVEGYDTVSLMQQARSQREKEEIALVCLMDVDEDTISELGLNCRYKNDCPMTNCRTLLRDLIEQELVA